MDKNDGTERLARGAEPPDPDPARQAIMIAWPRWRMRHPEEAAHERLPTKQIPTGRMRHREERAYGSIASAEGMGGLRRDSGVACDDGTITD